MIKVVYVLIMMCGNGPECVNEAPAEVNLFEEFASQKECDEFLPGFLDAMRKQGFPGVLGKCVRAIKY